jgi:hypothetical protein
MLLLGIWCLLLMTSMPGWYALLRLWEIKSRKVLLNFVTMTFRLRKAAVPVGLLIQ